MLFVDCCVEYLQVTRACMLVALKVAVIKICLDDVLVSNKLLESCGYATLRVEHIAILNYKG